MGTASSKHGHGHKKNKKRPKSAPGDLGPKSKDPVENYRPYSHSDPKTAVEAGNGNKKVQERSQPQGTSEVPVKDQSTDTGVGNRGTEEKADPVKDSGDMEKGSSETAGRGPSRSISMEPKDIMISYSHQDKDQMRQIRDGLEKAGVTVWVDEVGLKAGVEFFNKIGQAIVDAKLFLSLLSTRSVVSKYCKDELALAYVSSKPIFPCALESREDMIPLMDFGMRLQLAPVEWTMFSDTAAINQSMMELVKKIQSKLTELNQAEKTDKRGKFQRQRSHLNLHSKPAFDVKKEVDFWDKNFKGQSSVDWEKFEAVFLEEYSSQLDEMFKNVDQLWLLSILNNEMDEDSDGIVTKQHYNEFCTVNGERCEFWQRVQEHALESYTMREVFSMNSTVRIDAIQNLSKFHSSSVLEALLDLCSDKDENVRAVAALSLARVADPQNKHAVGRMMNLLKDKDRLVRESGCLALGHIKAEEAAPQLVNLWRNDAISNVREAAQVALEKIGGEEAKKAMHITKVLSDEIKKLSEAQ
ncbi:uncharacterized protein LOC119730313 [Patiria miniata]|uniref:TIR domain-containing protein n=1 Tax=Patiria miniata TaxID=46514 RepID=A0A914A6G2_PATMI|nr:uncharacterized protein LOC119730313 [Patiria miniata]XP_038059075.1 uncharacterized protein LOC119730313 [Patiria miniata]